MEGIQPSDADLVRRALGATTDQQRTAAFEAIADKYRLTVLRQCASWFPDPEAAQDVGQAAFGAAFTLLAQGKGPERPDKLAGWLIEIARRRGQEYIRKTKPAGVQWADLPEGRGLDETEDDEEDRSGSASRRAHATKLVERVVATFTDRQQEIYQLRFVQELTGREIAGRLGIADKAASNEATIVQGLIADGFGALILMQEGRRYCPNLARILDDAAKTQPATTPTFAPAPSGADIFTTVLRQRIVNHFNDCNVCDNCRTCNSKRRQLVGPYVPALIPIVFAGEFRDRIDEVIRRVVEQAHADHNPPRQTDSTPPVMAGAAAATQTRAVLDDYVSQHQTPGGARRPAPHGGQKGAPRAGKGRKGRLSAKPLVAGAAVVAAVVALVVVLQSGSSGSSSMPISATSALPAVTGYTYVQYLGGADASATISGQVNGAASGEIVRLYARPFPFTATSAPAGSLTLQPSSSPGTYSFRVTPGLATQYQVELFKNVAAAKPLATSATTTIYVVAIPRRVGAPTCVGSPTCHLTETHDIFMPASALSTEMSKTWYSYLGVNLSSSGTPPLPATLQLGAGNPVIGKPRQLAANAFSVTISYTFNVGNGGWHFHSTLCAKDTEAQDGIGLPGSHGCGNATIPGSYAYLG